MPLTYKERIYKHRDNNRDKYNEYMRVYSLNKYKTETDEWRTERKRKSYEYFKKRVNNDPIYAEQCKEKKRLYYIKKKADQTEVSILNE